jgi:hypothetical protein
VTEAGHRWIADLGRELPIQARLLERLLAAVEADERWEWLELGCSVADGRGDPWSDLDAGLGFIGEPPAPDAVTRMVEGLAPVIDLSVQPWQDVTRWWVQYVDGGQLDLVVMPAERRPGRAPRSVALLDRSGRLAEEFLPRAWRASPDEPRQWLMDGWEALGNVAKYLARSSVLEAIEQLHRARQRVLQLWAVGEGVDYPSFGLTSLLDDAEATPPSGIEATYAVASIESVREAARKLAALLEGAGHHARPDLDTDLREFVTSRLEAHPVSEPPR